MDSSCVFARIDLHIVRDSVSFCSSACKVSTVACSELFYSNWPIFWSKSSSMRLFCVDTEHSSSILVSCVFYTTLLVSIICAVTGTDCCVVKVVDVKPDFCGYTWAVDSNCERISVVEWFESFVFMDN